MNDIRLIAADVDGTMLPRGGEISPNLRRAIGQCRERGIPFIIASGRWIGAMGDVIDRSGVGRQPVIIANGAAILDGDRAPLREWLLDDADARRVYDLLCTFDVQINGYGRGVLYCLKRSKEFGVTEDQILDGLFIVAPVAIIRTIIPLRITPSRMRQKTMTPR